MDTTRIVHNAQLITIITIITTITTTIIIIITITIVIIIGIINMMNTRLKIVCAYLLESPPMSESYSFSEA